MRTTQIDEQTQWLKQVATQLGFSFVGVSAAGPLDEEARKLEAWLHQGKHGKMAYMERHFDKRIDPTKLVEGAKSVVTFLFNYHQPKQQTDPNAPKLSQYAYGEDYHYVIKDKLRQLMALVEEEIGAVDGRLFVDSAPVLEKAWAQRSGVGWIGKHTNLITKQSGSYFFLAEWITSLPLTPDGPIKDYCGSCTRCIDACPTAAITAPYQLDASKCISYLTIELRDAELPAEFAGKMDNWMFGCDVCQAVCPWNRFAKPHNEPRFTPQADLLDQSKEEWYELTEAVFKQLFRKSAVKRTKYAGLKRNIAFLKARK